MDTTSHTGEAYKGPAKFTPEEVARGNVGIRWVTAEGVAGRPTMHDVREYLAERGESAVCTCEQCKAWMLSNEQVSALRASHAQLKAALQAIVDLDDGDSPDLWHYEDEFNAGRQALSIAEDLT